MSYRQHYVFAHRTLPALFASNRERLLELLGEPSALLGLWKETPGKPFPPKGLRGEVLERDGQQVGLITMPAPRKTPEAYFIALVFAERPRYFVLEKSFHGTILGLWNPRGNLGAGPPPEREAFLSAVFDFLSHPQELTHVEFDYGQINLAAGELNRYLNASPEKPITVTPEKLASFHCFLLHCTRRLWRPDLLRAARASWWSIFYRRKVTDLFACYSLTMFQGQIYQQDPVAATKFTMAAVMATAHAFPRGAKCWESRSDESDPHTLAREMAEVLNRHNLARALEAQLEAQLGIIRNRLQSVVLFYDDKR